MARVSDGMRPEPDRWGFMVRPRGCGGGAAAGVPLLPPRDVAPLWEPALLRDRDLSEPEVKVERGG